MHLYDFSRITNHLRVCVCVCVCDLLAYIYYTYIFVHDNVSRNLYDDDKTEKKKKINEQTNEIDEHMMKNDMEIWRTWAHDFAE